ncbi:MAG: glycosyl hydrolase family 65 protein [Eubacteriales bacterium]
MTEEERQKQKVWNIRQTEFDASRSDFYDSIFFQGNGYIGVRGFHDEYNSCEDYLRTTFMSGVYEYIKKDISDMVNTPNVFATNINTVNASEEKSPVTPADSLNGRYDRSLNLYDGVLSKTYQTNKEGGTLEVKIDRFLSMDDVHLAVQRLSLASIDFEGDLELIFAVDGNVRNNTIHDEQLKKEMNPVSLLTPVLCEENDDYLLLVQKTAYSDITIAEAMCVEISPETQILQVSSLISEDRRNISCNIRIHMVPGQTAVFCKKVYVCTSRDPEEWENPVTSCVDGLMNTAKSSWDSLSDCHCEAWKRRWAESDIEIKGDDVSQLELRFAIFNLIANYPENDPRCSIGARGLTHGRYKGCYFWDTEMYMMPFYLLTNPDSAKNLLMYRYNTLDTARDEAKRFNLSGARYSWMCTPDGREQCETWDTGSSEIHITADIAYSVDLYWRITGDNEFIVRYGLEMLIEISRYWVSRFSYNSVSDTYNLLWVKGPNEYGGVTINNTFTVTLAVYGFETAQKMLLMAADKFPDLYKAAMIKTDFHREEIVKWNQISSHIHISYDSARNLLLEDDLFMLGEPVDISCLKTDNQPLYKKISFDRLQRMRVLKQADILLLMGLLPERYTAAQKKAAWEFYEPITLHDSTLSYGTHSWVGSMFGYDQKAFSYFQKSAGLDLENLMNNTAEEGLHLAAFGGTWMTAVFGFAGLSLRGEEIMLNPHLPVSWQSISFPFKFRHTRYICTVDHNSAKVHKV